MISICRGVYGDTCQQAQYERHGGLVDGSTRARISYLLYYTTCTSAVTLSSLDAGLPVSLDFTFWISPFVSSWACIPDNTISFSCSAPPKDRCTQDETKRSCQRITHRSSENNSPIPTYNPRCRIRSSANVIAKASQVSNNQKTKNGKRAR